MKQFLAIFFIGGISVLFGFAKGAGIDVHMPEITTVATKDSVSNFNDLSAKWVKNTVEINWTAYTEFDCKQFEIQRSVDGTNFKTVGIIFTLEVADKTKAYKFKDALKGKEKGVLTYRIKQVSLSEDCSFSQTVALHKR